MEYGMIIGFVVVIAVGVLAALGQQTGGLFSRANNQVRSAVPGSPATIPPGETISPSPIPPAPIPGFTYSPDPVSSNSTPVTFTDTSTGGPITTRTWFVNGSVAGTNATLTATLPSGSIPVDLRVLGADGGTYNSYQFIAVP